MSKKADKSWWLVVDGNEKAVDFRCFPPPTAASLSPLTHLSSPFLCSSPDCNPHAVYNKLIKRRLMVSFGAGIVTEQQRGRRERETRQGTGRDASRDLLPAGGSGDHPLQPQLHPHRKTGLPHRVLHPPIPMISCSSSSSVPGQVLPAVVATETASCVCVFLSLGSIAADVRLSAEDRMAGSDDTILFMSERILRVQRHIVWHRRS
jgi:hypothetical protein